MIHRFHLSAFGSHRELHSFPTRRSSDLAFSILGGGKIAYVKPIRSEDVHSLYPEAPALQRSEEHTSELQSHSELVCRLLLEKKKLLSPYWQSSEPHPSTEQ